MCHWSARSLVGHGRGPGRIVAAAWCWQANSTWRQPERADVCDDLTRGPWTVRAFPVEPARQRCEASFLEHLANPRRTAWGIARLESFVDLIHQVIALAESYNGVASGALECCDLGPHFGETK